MFRCWILAINSTYNALENAFSEMSESERKEKTNQSIKTLCILDIEKIVELEYNNSVIFLTYSFILTS